MFCSITKEPVQEPVISKKTGHLYEKRIIKKYLEDNHKCPITGEDMSEDDLIELKTGTSTLAGKPRPPTATSIPALLSLFQNEWDSVMLETFQLKQQYQKVRQELSHALYQHDAACRVIARLTKERNEARQALIELQQTMGPTQAQTQNGDDEMEDIPNGITPEIIENLSKTSNELSSVRRKKKPGPEIATHSDIRSFTNKKEIPSLHSATTSGILSVDLLNNPTQKVTWALTGGKDGYVNIIDYEKEGGSIVSTEKAHAKKINEVQWYTKQERKPGAFFTTSADKTVKLWNCNMEEAEDSHTLSNVYTFKGHHSADITSLSIHATGDYFATASADSTWSFVDLETGKLITQVSNEEVNTGFSCAKFHPDGLIYATGTNDSQIRIWDIKSQNNVATFPGHIGKITSLSFAENGYHLASCSDGESVIRIWDLRKLRNVHSIEFENASKDGLQFVTYDLSAQYLAAACGSNIKVYLNKHWDELVSLQGHTDSITSMCWGVNSKSLASVSMDRSLRFYEN